MTDRKRDPLPEGYQFGDAGRQWYERKWRLRHTPGWFGSMPHVTANVIEAEQFDPLKFFSELFASDADHHQTVEGEKV